MNQKQASLNHSTVHLFTEEEIADLAFNASLESFELGNDARDTIELEGMEIETWLAL
jgi:hypothetical protein